LALIRAAGARVAGILVALDRQERGQGDRSATQELAHEYGVPVTAIVSLADLMDYAGTRPDLAAQRDRLAAYRDRYGVAAP
jgi:orotate phosphoribosyltransferase